MIKRLYGALSHGEIWLPPAANGIKRLCLGLCGRKAEQVIRLLFKLCVILCLIFIGLSYFMPARPPQPGESESEAASSAGIWAGAAAFGAFIADIDGFCARNPQSCETGKSLFGTLADRAGQGAAVAYKWFGATLQKGAENTEQHLAAEESKDRAGNAAAADVAEPADKAADSAAAKPVAAAENAEAAKPAPAAAPAPAAKTTAKATRPTAATRPPEVKPAAARAAKTGKSAPAAHAAHREKTAKAPPLPQAAPAAKSKTAKAAAEPIPGARPRHKAKNTAE